MAIKTITVKGDPVVDEYAAAAAITPGHLVEIASTGKVQVHSTSAGPARTCFALEDDLQGNEIGEAYAADDRVQVGTFKPGDRVFALLADGENASIGSKLESNGDGTLKVYDGTASAGDLQTIIGEATEAVDMSGSSGADPSGRITVLIW